MATHTLPARPPTGGGFTLIEMLVVMAVMATLLAIAVPRYHASVEKSREAVLHQNLALLRETLDKYYGDKGKYPDALEDLVRANYLRRIPLDPVTGSDSTWVSVPPLLPEMGGVFDIRSGAQGAAHDGTPFQNW
jgi:general secretion pathway protein G